MIKIDAQYSALINKMFQQELIKDYNLDRVKKLYDMMRLKSKLGKIIHVAGTNGKGSVCRMCYSILMESGKSVGIFTSPHIHDIRERFEYNGELITKAEFVEIVLEIESYDIDLSFFEMCVMIALIFFSNKNAKYIILEVGLGGRLDATNIIIPTITAITSISFDHQHILGHSLNMISREKSGIIKQNIPLIISEKNTVIENTAKNLNARVIFSTPKETNLIGDHQKINAGIAWSIMEYLGIEENTIQAGLKKVIHKGRLDYIYNNLLVDGAHNEGGLHSLKLYLANIQSNFTDVKLCVSIKKGKSAKLIIQEFDEFDSCIIIDHNSNMLEDPLELKNQLNDLGFNAIIKTPKEIADLSQHQEDILYLVFGSLYVIDAFYNL